MNKKATTRDHFGTSESRLPRGFHGAMARFGSSDGGDRGSRRRQGAETRDKAAESSQRSNRSAGSENWFDHRLFDAIARAARGYGQWTSGIAVTWSFGGVAMALGPSPNERNTDSRGRRAEGKTGTAAGIQWSVGDPAPMSTCETRPSLGEGASEPDDLGRWPEAAGLGRRSRPRVPDSPGSPDPAGGMALTRSHA